MQHLIVSQDANVGLVRKQCWYERGLAEAWWCNFIDDKEVSPFMGKYVWEYCQSIYLQGDGLHYSMTQFQNYPRGCSMSWRAKAAGWTSRNEGRKCYACHDYGHIAADCPSARRIVVEPAKCYKHASWFKVGLISSATCIRVHLWVYLCSESLFERRLFRSKI